VLEEGAMNDDNKVTIEGWLGIKDHGDSDDILFIGERRDMDDSEPVGEVLEFMHRKTVTVRYWAVEEKCTKEEASEDFLCTLMGSAEVKYGARYSEITGYLWTDEDLMVGGHDLMSELKGYEGRYLIIEVEIMERAK
jgi:hypothetical protein